MANIEKSQPFTTQSPHLISLKWIPFENIVEKGQNAGNQHFFLFPQYFLPCQRQIQSFQPNLNCCLQILSIWEIPQFCRWAELTHYQMTNFRLLKLKEFADDNFTFDENGRKSSKWVENTVGKRVLLVTSNFSFSHSVFKRLVSQGHQKASLCGNGLKVLNLLDSNL